MYLTVNATQQSRQMPGESQLIGITPSFNRHKHRDIRLNPSLKLYPVLTKETDIKMNNAVLSIAGVVA